VTNGWDHSLIRKGMAAQLETRRARLSAGEQRLGWKVGLGAPASMQKLGISSPAVGFLLHSGLLSSGASVSLKHYERPVAEPEICARMARDLGEGATAHDAFAAIASIEPAIELADLDPVPAPDNLDAVLAGNIFHRHVILGENRRAGGALDGIVSRVTRRGIEFNRTDEPEALTGKLLDIVAYVANLLAAFGETLKSGDIIITGSITAPVMLEADETAFAHALDPIGEVRVAFTRD
jgi:2-keto-4-pentenoate hydratase